MMEMGHLRLFHVLNRSDVFISVCTDTVLLKKTHEGSEGETAEMLRPWEMIKSRVWPSSHAELPKIQHSS